MAGLTGKCQALWWPRSDSDCVYGRSRTRRGLPRGTLNSLAARRCHHDPGHAGRHTSASPSLVSGLRPRPALMWRGRRGRRFGSADSDAASITGGFGLMPHRYLGEPDPPPTGTGAVSPSQAQSDGLPESASVSPSQLSFSESAAVTQCQRGSVSPSHSQAPSQAILGRVHPHTGPSPS